MNELLQEKLVEIMELGQTGVLEAVSIIKTQAPELINQFMAFETFSTSMAIFFGLVGFVIGLKAFFHLKKMKWDLNGSSEFLAVMLMVFVGGSGGAVAITYSFILAKILIAPNVYIIENLLTLLR